LASGSPITTRCRRIAGNVSKNCKTGHGRPLPARLKAEILREIDRLELVLRQIGEVKAERDGMLRSAEANSPAVLLMRIKGIGAEFAAVLYLEGLFRHFEKPTAVGGLLRLGSQPMEEW
jgi:transposase